MKMKRINEIRATGLEVGHVAHQHGIEQEKVAYQVEAALIDAYPGLTNLVDGRGSRDYGTRHVEEIVAQYAAEEFVVRESLLLIFIGRYLHVTGDPYDSVRCHWRVNVDRARGRLVLAQADGGAFETLSVQQRNLVWKLFRLAIRTGYEEKSAPGL